MEKYENLHEIETTDNYLVSMDDELIEYVSQKVRDANNGPLAKSILLDNSPLYNKKD
jgi:hypothetical protein